MTSSRIALVQLVSSHEVEKNLPEVASFVQQAAQEGAEAVFLPENFAALAHANPRVIGEQEATPAGIIRTLLATLAQENRVWLFAGTCPVAMTPEGAEVQAGRVRAASLVLNPDGVEVARYDKIHMFDVDVADNHKRYRESDVFEPGTEVVSVETPIGRIGLSVCYDIRFPELYRRLFMQNIDLVSVPSAFTRTTGEAHFRLLMRARAVENCCFTIAACQGGVHDSGRQTYGHSMVCDPWGRVVGELDEGEGLLVVDLDRSEQERLRHEMPFRQQIRLG